MMSLFYFSFWNSPAYIIPQKSGGWTVMTALYVLLAVLLLFFVLVSWRELSRGARTRRILSCMLTVFVLGLVFQLEAQHQNWFNRTIIFRMPPLRGRFLEAYFGDYLSTHMPVSQHKCLLIAGQHGDYIKYLAYPKALKVSSQDNFDCVIVSGKSRPERYLPSGFVITGRYNQDSLFALKGNPS